MKKEFELHVRKKYIKPLTNNFPLITEEMLIDSNLPEEEGTLLNLLDESGEFIAKGYYGRQNKGIGWVLTKDKQEKVDVAFFKKMLLRAMGKRQSFYHDENTNAFRVFNGEGDGIGGLTIDYFDGYYLLTWYSEGIYSFKEDLLQVLDEIDDYKAIYEKKRFNAKGKYVGDDDFVKGERGEFPIMIKENGINYAVYLNDGAMVGIFLDQRDVRQAIRETYAKGKKVLNTFSYTGAFSIAAALGGAKKTTSVDLAKRSKGKTIEQFSVNGLDFEEHDIIVMDVFDYFGYANRKNLKFDLVVLDPPSFARSKKRTFSTAKDYPKLIKDTISVTEEDGVIIASTNNASFGMKKFKEFIDKGFRQLHANYQIIDEFTLPHDFQVNRDFPQGNYLKVVIVKRQK